MRNLEDRALVALFKATRDRQTFGELYRRHSGAMHGYLLSIGVSSSKIDDIAQQTFLTAFRKIDQFRGEASFRTWLFTIGYRHHLQQHRRYKSEAQATERFQSTSREASFTPELDEGDRIAIIQALDQLSQDERSALILCDAYGYTHAEAAEITGKPLGTLKSYVQRARSKAKALLSKGEDSDG